MENQYPEIRYSAYYNIANLNEYVNLHVVEKKIDEYIKEIRCVLNLNELNDWKIKLTAVYCYTDAIRVLKRATRYVADMEVDVSLIVPIPDLEQANYGISEKRSDRITGADPAKFYILETDFSKYNNLTDYIFESVIRAIDECLKQGVTVNGKKIKYQTK